MTFLTSQTLETLRTDLKSNYLSETETGLLLKLSQKSRGKLISAKNKMTVLFTTLAVAQAAELKKRHEWTVLNYRNSGPQITPL
jgi:hypothetical protein